MQSSGPSSEPANRCGARPAGNARRARPGQQTNRGRGPKTPGFAREQLSANFLLRGSLLAGGWTASPPLGGPDGGFQLRRGLDPGKLLLVELNAVLLLHLRQQLDSFERRKPQVLGQPCVCPGAGESSR